MEQMVFHYERIVVKLPYQLGGGCWLYPVKIIQRFHRCHIVGSRTNATDIRHNPGQLLHRSTQTKNLKPSELHHLPVGIFYIALIVQKDLDFPMSLKSGYWIYSYLFGHIAPLSYPTYFLAPFFCNIEAGSENRYRYATGSITWSIILAISSSLCASKIDASAETNLAPESTPPSTGPKHPRHGILIFMQASPQPSRVAGPRQIIPWARKQTSGSASTS